MYAVPGPSLSLLSAHGREKDPERVGMRHVDTACEEAGLREAVLLK